jgi:hypothetical protein
MAIGSETASRSSTRRHLLSVLSERLAGRRYRIVFSQRHDCDAAPTRVSISSGGWGSTEAGTKNHTKANHTEATPDGIELLRSAAGKDSLWPISDAKLKVG